MAKRMTDTDIWDKQWFMELKPRLKCLVKYVRDKCNIAGVWDPNWTLASTYIGEKVTEKELLSIDGGRQFIKTDEGKIYCVGFVQFQYGENLNEKSPVHKKVIEHLKKYQYSGHTLLDTLANTLRSRVLNTPQEKEEEEDKEKEEDIKGGMGGDVADGEGGQPKEPSLYKQAVDLYFDWFKKLHDGTAPKFDTTHGRAMKSILHHLAKNVKAKAPGLSPPELDEGTIKALKYIFDNWHTLSEFTQKFVDIRSMNTNINRILTELKSSINGTATNRKNHAHRPVITGAASGAGTL